MIQIKKYEIEADKEYLAVNKLAKLHLSSL